MTNASREPKDYAPTAPGAYPPSTAPGFRPDDGQPPRDPRSGLIIGLAVGGLVLLALIGLGTFLIASTRGPGGVADRPRSTVEGFNPPRSDRANGSPPINPDAPISGDGTFLIGEDIEPGEYSTKVPANSGLCYWERLKGTDGSFDDILANGTAGSGEQVHVTIKKSDKAFSTTGCGAWKKN